MGKWKKYGKLLYTLKQDRTSMGLISTVHDTLVSCDSEETAHLVCAALANAEKAERELAEIDSAARDLIDIVFEQCGGYPGTGDSPGSRAIRRAKRLREILDRGEEAPDA